MPQLVLNVKTEKKENSKESRMIKANVFVKKVLNRLKTRLIYNVKSFVKTLNIRRTP